MLREGAGPSAQPPFKVEISSTLTLAHCMAQHTKPIHVCSTVQKERQILCAHFKRAVLEPQACLRGTHLNMCLTVCPCLHTETLGAARLGCVSTHDQEAITILYLLNTSGCPTL